MGRPEKQILETVNDSCFYIMQHDFMETLYICISLSLYIDIYMPGIEDLCRGQKKGAA